MPIPTDIPAAFPERLADAEGERDRLREKVRLLTIQRNAQTTILDGHRQMGWDRRAEHLARVQLDSQREANARLTDEVDALTARLTAAESAREALKAEIREQAMKQLASDAGWELDWDKVRAERDAALARAERAEKALDFYRSAAVTSATMEGLNYRGVSNSMFRHAWEADRAALAHPDTAEET